MTIPFLCNKRVGFLVMALFWLASVPVSGQTPDPGRGGVWLTPVGSSADGVFTTLNVTGATTLDSTLGVTGASTLNNTVLINQNGITPLTIRRDSGTAGHGVGFSFKMGDSASVTAAHEYATLYQSIATNTNGAEVANLTLNLSRAGSLAEIFRIFGGSGNVSIGDTNDSGKLNVAKDTDITTYFGRGYISSTGTSMTADRAHFGHIDNENATDYALVQTAAGATTLNSKTGQAIWFGINAGAIGNWTATGLRVGDATTATAKLDVNGSLSKTSGSFKIDHPLPSMTDTHNLVHSFIEGPRADLIYRGVATIQNGAASVNIDTYVGMTTGTWEALTRSPQVWVSNVDGWEEVRGTIDGGTVMIESRDATATDIEVNWLVVAERDDPHIIQTAWTDTNGNPILEPAKD